MATEAAPKLHVYHVYDGKMVVDVCDHTDQLEAHYKGDPKFTRRYLAGSHGPLTPEEVKRLEAHYENKHDASPRPPMKPWKPPEKPTRKPFTTAAVPSKKAVK